MTKQQSTFVVKYLTGNGRVGIIRPMLHLKGAQYTNEIVTFENVAANRTDYPFGHIPMLIETKPDGTKFELGESLAIEQYLAEKFDLLGSTPEEKAIQKSIALNIYFEIYNHCFAGKIPIQEAVADPNSEFLSKALPQFLTCHERWLSKNGNNGHYFGDELTYPDLVLLHWARMMQGLGVKLDENSPVKKLENTLKEMKEWQGMYDTFHPFGSVDA
ncbi:hypothetical protein BGZ47_002343 [Haplosporangium gracile]|nr:hypothetical protein BGZ47_002343 [Haplosporangium gracile]